MTKEKYDYTDAWLRENFVNVNQGVAMILDLWQVLHGYYKKRMVSRFSNAELEYIIGAGMNYYVPQIPSAEAWVKEIRVYSLNSGQPVPEKVIEKINEMCPGEVMFWRVSIYVFYERMRLGVVDVEVSVNDFINDFLSVS